MKGKGNLVAVWVAAAYTFWLTSSELLLSNFKAFWRCYLVNLIGLPCKFQPFTLIVLATLIYVLQKSNMGDEISLTFFPKRLANIN